MTDHTLNHLLIEEFNTIWARKMRNIVQFLGIDLKRPHKRNSSGNIWRDEIDWMPKKSIVLFALSESELNFLKVFIEADMWPFPETGDARARKAAGLAVWSALLIVTVDTQDDFRQQEIHMQEQEKDLCLYCFTKSLECPKMMKATKESGFMAEIERVLGRGKMIEIYRNKTPYVSKSPTMSETPEQAAASEIKINKWIFSECCKDPAFMQEWKDNGGMEKTKAVLGREVMGKMYRNRIKIKD